ncbi:MAG: hypothetical protein IPO98_18740 [Saprospiraceae bacterium]|nr:hypothetical protein [Saprospiraceae bacterium]
MFNIQALKVGTFNVLIWHKKQDKKLAFELEPGFTPYIQDPTNPNTIYAGYSDVWKSTDKGDSWTKISTVNSTNKLKNIFVAPSNTQVIIISDNTKIWKTTNGGTSWSEITGSLPTNYNLISSILIKNGDHQTYWVTLAQFDTNKVFQTSDGGTTWINISDESYQLPAYSLIQNKQILSETHLYIGTELGIYLKRVCQLGSIQQQRAASVKWNLDIYENRHGIRYKVKLFAKSIEVHPVYY